MVPYMLSMRLNDEHICGAVIIGQNWSLTAAHCCIEIVFEGRIFNFPSEDFNNCKLKNTIISWCQEKHNLLNCIPTATEILTMRSGSSWLDGDTTATVHQVTKKVRLPEYRDDDDDYDLCAVQVEPSFKFSKSVRPVKLPEPGVPLKVDWGLVSGWGYDKVGRDKLSPILKSTSVNRVDLEICKSAYRISYTVHDHDICYGSGDNLRDACQGDSGGPLVNKDFILIGIVSFGFDCGFSDLPGVYTDITQFRSWIKNITRI